MIKHKLTSDIHLAELLKGSGTAFVLRVVGMGVGYLFILLVSRAYGTDAVGVLALCMTLLSITSLVGRLGFDTAMIRFIAQFNSTGEKALLKEVYQKALKVVVPVSVVLSLLAYLSAGLIAQNIFKKPHLEIYFRVSTLAVVPLVLLHINKQSLRGLKRILEFSLLDRGIDFLISLLLIIPLSLLFGKHNIYPVLAYIFGIIGAGVMSQYIWFKHLKIKHIHKKVSLGLNYKEMLRVSLSMFFISSMSLIMHWTDTFMLGMFRTEAEVGVYTVALRVATLTSLSLFAINSIAAPKFAELYAKNDMEGLKNTVQHSTRLIFWTSAPVLLVFVLFPSFVLGIFGADFKEGAIALVILSAGQFINAISGSVGYFMNMTGREKAFQNILLLATLINVVLNYILIPLYGINGAAVATMFSMVFWNFSSVVYVRYETGILTLYVPGVK